MTAGLPPVSSTTDAFLSVLAQRQDHTNELLAQILDRLPKGPPVHVGTVELREPVAPTGDGGEPDASKERPASPVEVTEPATTRPARKRATKTKGA